MAKKTLHPGGREVDTHPGLFVYEGFGMGNLYTTETDTLWLSTSEAQAKAKELGMEWEYVDSFDGYKPVYLGD